MPFFPNVCFSSCAGLKRQTSFRGRSNNSVMCVSSTFNFFFVFHGRYLAWEKKNFTWVTPFDVFPHSDVLVVCP